MAASQLESQFWATQEDFDKIITSTRAMLKEDKEDLQRQAEQGYHVSVLNPFCFVFRYYNDIKCRKTNFLRII